MSSDDECDAAGNDDGQPVAEGNEMLMARLAMETASANDPSLANFPAVGQHLQNQLLFPGNFQQRELSHFATQTHAGTQNSQPNLSRIDSRFGANLLSPFPAFATSSGSTPSALPLSLNDRTLLHSSLARNAARSAELRSLLASQPRSLDSGISAFVQQGVLPLDSMQIQRRALCLAQYARALEAERQRRSNERAYFPRHPTSDLSADTSFANPSQVLLPQALASSESMTQPLEVGASVTSPEASSTKRKRRREGKSQSSISLELNELKKPSRPLTAYNIFFKHERLRLIDEASGNSGAGHRIPFAVMGKKIGARWKELSQEEKEPYVEAAQQDKVRHQRGKEEYNERKEALLAAHHRKQMSSVESAVLSKYYEDHQGRRNLPRHPSRDSPEDRKPSARSDCSEDDESN